MMEAHRKRTGRDPQENLRIGEAAAILERTGEFVEAGAFKFILAPPGGKRRDQL